MASGASLTLRGCRRRVLDQHRKPRRQPQLVAEDYPLAGGQPAADEGDAVNGALNGDRAGFSGALTIDDEDVSAILAHQHRRRRDR